MTLAYEAAVEFATERKSKYPEIEIVNQTSRAKQSQLEQEVTSAQRQPSCTELPRQARNLTREQHPELDWDKEPMPEYERWPPKKQEPMPEYE